MMHTFLLPLLAKWGVPEELRRPLQWAILIALAVLAFFAVKALYDANVVEDYENERAVESIEARDTAAEQRATDAIANAETEKELIDAIEQAPEGGELSPAARALACQRLRNAGVVSAACGSDGGN
ncbi:hypothetical protein [Qipengyuania atrilutea]|uniref:Uncharacterized protein n=1 Tax=Qipengyuania atrilutea TaxID=2744473 RepID=A0A850H1I0_9SPHN|nr:hypothetical protein [Actirhodobacter atriluteus]NVD44380.1 hypothetical protein [Actirhodobacter atriluteus]